MKRFFAILLFATVSIYFSPPLYAAPAKKSVPLAADDSKIYIGLDFRHETYSPPTSFDVSSPSGLSHPADIVLSRYYAYAKANDTESIQKLFFSADGSLDALLRKLKLNAPMFSNYGTLQQVRIDSKSYWGGYQFINVLLSGGAGTQEWREDLLCQGNDCKISIAFDNSTEKEQMLETLLLWTDAFLSSTYDQNDLDTKMSVLRAADRKISLYPDYLPPGPPTYPITFYANLEQLADGTFQINPKEGENDPPPPGEVQAILDMLKAAASSDRNTIETALAAHFTSMPGGGFFRMTEKNSEKDDSPAGLISTAFPWTSFYERVETWTSLRILGIARSGAISYVFVEPGMIDTEAQVKKDTIQLFTVLYRQDADEYKLVTDSDQLVPWYILKTSIFMEFIDKQYR